MRKAILLIAFLLVKLSLSAQLDVTMQTNRANETLNGYDYASVTLSSNQYNEIGQVETTSLLNGIHN
ncbi:MAG: hypothetical protein K2J74_00195, partial [Muribaculaceae bacterium]|nr:hypothetical protein [Muribaculaceae bacterium]